jgi:phage terminase small subunit
MAKVQKDTSAFKREYRKSGSVRSSALAAGYSQSVANMGLHAMPKSIQTYVLTRHKKLSKLAQLGRSIDPQQQEDLLRGAIFANIAAGKDQANQSIKLGMQDRRVNMLSAESQQGVFIIEMPAHLASRIQPKAGPILSGNVEPEN